MQVPDLLNASFELSGAILSLLNVRCIIRDKVVRGVSWAVVVFWAAWGGWNLFYYFHLEQWLSWVAGAALCAVNAVYASLLVYYTLKERRHGL